MLGNFNLSKARTYAIVLIAAVLTISASFALTSEGLGRQSADDARHSYEIKVIDRLLERFHYKRYRLDDELSQHILDNFIDSLDPSKLFFTDKDIQEITKLENDFDEYIRRGVTTAYHNIFTIYRTRVDERIDYALQRLEHNFNFNIEEYYELDRSESPWAKNEAELNTLWRKRIKNDLINLDLSGDGKEKARETLRKRYQNIAKRTTQIKGNEIFQIYINAYANAIEPHTSYFSPRATEEFNISMRLSLQGIGAVLRTTDNQTEIVNIVPGGPADQSGLLHADDKITAVAQGAEGELIDIIGWRLSDVVDLIRGPKGSNVRLTIIPAALGANAAAKEISLVRDNIKLESQAARSQIIEVDTDAGKSKLGIIDLPSFYIDFDARSRGEQNYRSTTRDVADLIKSLKQEKVDGIIIDLRGNGGGSLEEVVTLTGLFIDEGPIVQVKNSEGRIRTHRDIELGSLYDGPLAVMVDRQSASASEIFAGAIQDYKRGLIIGEPTFGKGTVQNVLPLSAYAKEKFKDKLGQIKITIAQFFRINGDSTQHRGVIPDINWPFPENDQPFGERALDNALPWLHINKSKFAYSHLAIDKAELEHLKLKHQRRIANNDAFNAALEKEKLLVEARLDKHVSLNKLQRKTKQNAFNKQLLAVENEIRLANGEKAYDSFKKLRESQKKQREERTYSSKAPIKPDAFMTETANILNDLLHLTLVQIAGSKQVKKLSQ